MKKSNSASGRLASALRSLFGLEKQEEKPPDDQSYETTDNPVEMLRDLPWLSKLEDGVFQQMLDGFECRQFPEGATLLKEEDPDNGMFVIVEGKVNIEIRGIAMNVVGSGSLIGEMSVLTGYPRSASIVAVTSVTVVWIESATLKSIMKKSVELENGLWEFASKRFAMNLLGRREPYNQWEQNIFIQWLAAGEIKVPNENGWIDLKGKVGVLVTGTAALPDGGIINSPASLKGPDYIFSKEARVFLRDK
ncbi:MAG: cyclic nucleotide-binding domain-containing protein [Bacteroidales bacterium]|nr:cyclic nucleotide-binding domain-containing protein [Bacteroidales bacterium]